MAIDRNFRTIGSFDTDDEDKLSRQLTALEDNAVAAVTAVALSSMPLFAPTNRKTADYIAGLDELVTVDSSGGNRAVTLPIAKPANGGHFVAIARTSASNAVTARCASGLINLAATYTVAASVGLTLFLSDGVGWWAK